MTPNVDDALALARAIGRADREAVDTLLDDLAITSPEKAASLIGYLCGLLIGMAQLHAARTGESWEDLLTQFGKVAISEQVQPAWLVDSGQRMRIDRIVNLAEEEED